MDKIYYDLTHIRHRNNFRWTMDLNVKINNKACRKNIGQHHHDFIVNKDFLNRIHKLTIKK